MGVAKDFSVWAIEDSDHLRLQSVPLNRVDGKFSWCICCCLNKHHPIGAIKPTHLKVVLMRKHISKIQVACNPVDGDATNSI